MMMRYAVEGELYDLRPDRDAYGQDLTLRENLFSYR